MSVTAKVTSSMRSLVLCVCACIDEVVVCRKRCALATQETPSCVTCNTHDLQTDNDTAGHYHIIEMHGNEKQEFACHQSSSSSITTNTIFPSYLLKSVQDAHFGNLLNDGGCFFFVSHVEFVVVAVFLDCGRVKSWCDCCF